MIVHDTNVSDGLPYLDRYTDLQAPTALEHWHEITEAYVPSKILVYLLGDVKLLTLKNNLFVLKQLLRTENILRQPF